MFKFNFTSCISNYIPGYVKFNSISIHMAVQAFEQGELNSDAALLAIIQKQKNSLFRGSFLSMIL